MLTAALLAWTEDAGWMSHEDEELAFDHAAV